MCLFFDGLYLGLCLFMHISSLACVFFVILLYWLVSFHPVSLTGLCLFPLPHSSHVACVFLLPILDDFLKKKTHAIAHVKIFYYLCTRKRTAMINEDRGSDNICHYVGWSWEDNRPDSRRNQPQRLAYPQGRQACYQCPSLCGNLPLSINLY